MQHARVMVLLHGAATSSTISPQMHQQSPADAPTKSRGTTRIHWLVTVMGIKAIAWRGLCWTSSAQPIGVP